MDKPLQKRVGNSTGLTQAYHLRDLAAHEAMLLKDSPQPENITERSARARALRDLASVWTIASDRIRILRGRPLPGSLKPEKAPKKRKANQAHALFSEQPDMPANDVTPAQQKHVEPASPAVPPTEQSESATHTDEPKESL